MDKTKVHKIELREEFISPESEEKFNFCICDGIVKSIELDIRGTKNKFWILDGNRKNQYLVKYEDKKNESTAGQFIMCGALEQIGVPCAEYLVSEFVSKGIIKDSIISKNYKKKESEVEISAYSLNRKKSERDYDNNLGKKVRHAHTVYRYLDIFKQLYGRNDIDFDKIALDLKTYALIQYIFLLTDLHYCNLTFIYDEKLGHKSLRVADFYDCGNVSTLNIAPSKIKNNLERIRNSGKKSVVIENIIYKKMPLFGVKTEICHIEDEKKKGANICRPKSSYFSGVEEEIEAKKYLEILRNELAIEIIESPELYEVYKRIKDNVDIKKVANYYNAIKPETIPDFCVEMVEEIYNHNIKKLDKSIRKELLDRHTKKVEEEKLKK